MGYNHKTKRLEGLDGEAISRPYENIIRGLVKTQTTKRTASEDMFEQEVANVLMADYGVRYCSQKVFYIADQVSFIVDFYFPKFKVAVEIDGSIHNRPDTKERDLWRDSLIDRCGVVVLRFTNKQMDNPATVLDMVVSHLIASPKATPSYRKRLARQYRPYA